MPPKKQKTESKRSGMSRRRRPVRRGGQPALTRTPGGYTAPVKGMSGTPWRAARTWAMAGQEDVELVKMRYETSSAFTATSGTSSYLQIKGNAIYRPYPGNTDSPAGYQRLFTQYQQCVVLGSRLEVRIWSDTGAGVQQPFRMAAVPCTPAAYTIYSAYANVVALRGVPHSTEALFSPGATMPVLRASGTNAQVLNGSQIETGIEATAGTAQFAMGTGADPSSIWYYLVGLQALAGTTTLNAQIQVMIEYDVMFYRPIGTAVQQLTLNRWGNEEVPETKDICAGYKTPCAQVSILEKKMPTLEKCEELDDEDEAEFAALLTRLRQAKLQRQAGAGAGILPPTQVKYQEKPSADESKSAALKKPP